MEQPLPDCGIVPFSDCSNTSTYDCYTASSMTVDGSKDLNRHYQQRYTPSGSASPSFAQSLDHPPSTFSSASGASGQSKTSSTAGSPYSLAAHHRPHQDSWSESHQGLGIAPGILHSGSFTRDDFSGGTLEGELFFPEGKLSDSFVGESGRFALSSSAATRSTPASHPVPDVILMLFALIAFSPHEVIWVLPRYSSDLLRLDEPFRYPNCQRIRWTPIRDWAVHFAVSMSTDQSPYPLTM